MPKRRILTTKLKKIADKINIDTNEVRDFDSDDSVQDPDWRQNDSDAAGSELSDEQIFDDEVNLEDVLRELAVDEMENDESQMQSEDDEIIMNSVWSEYVGRHKDFPFTGSHGLQRDIEDISVFEAFSQIVDNEVVDHIVTETNRYAEQCILSKTPRKHARLTKWIPTNAEEIKKFLGLTLWMGLVRLNKLEDYWSTRNIYRMDIPHSIMSRNRYQMLLSMIHFNNNEEIERGDRLGKIRPLVDILQRKYQALYRPGENIVIDETLVPWRGRLIFKQYIPNKAHRYGIKLFKLCSIDGYTWAFKIYSGKSSTGEPDVGLARKVCLELSETLLNEGRTLYVDNFYTDYELAKSMLDKKTHLVGTLRANKKYLPKEVIQAKIKRGEIISREDQNGIVVLKWRDTRDVRLLSTKHAPVMVPIHSQCSQGPLSTNNNQITTQQQPSTSRQIEPTRKRKTVEKPLGIFDYNKGKTGIDLSDQMSSYATTLRKGIKWYRKLAIELLLGTSVVNAWVLFKHITKQKIHISDFRETLTENLMSIQRHKQKVGPTTSASSHHILSERINADGKKIRRKCSPCYAYLQRNKGRKEARNRSKMVYTYCNMCSGQPQLCLKCFNITHKKI